MEEKQGQDDIELISAELQNANDRHSRSQEEAGKLRAALKEAHGKVINGYVVNDHASKQLSSTRCPLCEY